MEMVLIFMLKARFIKVVGLRTNKKAMDEKSGLMVAIMKDNILEVKSMVPELLSGLTVPNTMGNGKIIKWTEVENSNGLMVEYIWANMKTIRNMDKAFINGQMVDFMKEDFIMVSNMERACTDKTMGRMFMAFGLKERSKPFVNRWMSLEN